MALGGSSSRGKSFMPSSNFACFAILTRSVSTSNQMMFLVVLGMNPRNIPLRELFRNFASRGVDGRTHTRQPNVRKFRKFSLRLVMISIGDLTCPRPTSPFRIRIM